MMVQKVKLKNPLILEQRVIDAIVGEELDGHPSQRNPNHAIRKQT